jgi:hypothetical protein
MRIAWTTLRRAGQPPLIAASLNRSLRRLGRAVRRHRTLPALRSALDVQQSVLDLQLRYRPRGAVEPDRMELWCQRLRVDARARDAAAVSGDAATLGWLRERFAATLAPDELRDLDARLGALQAAADAGRTAAAADHAAQLIGVLRRIPRP